MYISQCLWWAKKENPKKVDFIWLDLVSAFVSATIATTQYPFDVAKTRIQSGSKEKKWGKMLFDEIHNKEGFRACFKGYIPRVLRHGTGWAIMIFVYSSVHGKLLLVKRN